MTAGDAAPLPRPREEAGILALWPALVVVALRCALTFAVAGRYGWHRDELYYAVAGRHLQGGYVEFPPVTAFPAVLARVLFGSSLVGLRALTILAGAGTVLVGVLVARELGATRRAQTLAAAVIAFCPGMLATNRLFQPRRLRPARDDDRALARTAPGAGPGLVAVLGLAAGAGLETKYTLAVVLALAAGSIPLDRWLTPRRLGIAGAAFVAADLVALPILLPALPLRTAERHGVVSARGDYQSEIGWPGFVRQVEGLAGRADVIVAANYGEAGALELFGRGLPPVASVDVTMRYRRPAVAGRRALLVGYSRRSAGFCAGYRLVGRIATPHGSDERGGPIARCTLDGTLAQVWRRIVATADYTRF